MKYFILALIALNLALKKVWRLLTESLRGSFMSLSFWIAVVSVLVTLHADIFEQEDSPISASLQKPFKEFRDLFTEISLSDLLRASDSPTDSSKSPLYVFALDKSLNLKDSVISWDELDEYLKEAAQISSNIANECNEVVEGKDKDRTDFDIAKFELCRYVCFIPEGSRIALWFFGEDPAQRYPAGNGDPRQRPRWDDWKTDRGRQPIWNYLSTFSDARPNEDKSNFDKLLGELSSVYKNELADENETGSSKGEVHFVIMSDFIHDIGGLNILSAVQQEATIRAVNLEKSRYRVDAWRIESKFSELARRPNVTFHFSVISRSRESLNMLLDVVPIIDTTLDWTRFRKTKLQLDRARDSFDFLRPYEDRSKDNFRPIEFSYTPGAREPDPVVIIADNEEFKKSKLRFELTSDRPMDDSKFKMKIFQIESNHRGRYEISADNRGKVLSANTAGHVADIVRSDDAISIQPTSVLSNREAEGLYLLISWHKDIVDRNDPRLKKTLKIPLRFYKKMSRLGAAGMSIAWIGLFSSALWFLFALVRALRDFWITIKREVNYTSADGTVNTMGKAVNTEHHG